MTEQTTTLLYQMVDKLKNKVSSMEVELEYKRKREVEEEERKWKKRDDEDDVSLFFGRFLIVFFVQCSIFKMTFWLLLRYSFIKFS